MTVATCSSQSETRDRLEAEDLSGGALGYRTS